ncbi:2,3-butanediol dehydrogenase [Patulibacter sp. NPDC049589]|uniref:2,3-butanediol dehydrogenase n=1 Tax=Patulibacter sp. NPDC049589 TaxID=3154731 RepID=UPI0034300C24
MQALRFHGAQDIRLDDVAEPQTQAGQVKIKVHWCGICGSDLHEYLAGPIMTPTPDAPHPLTGESMPLTMGHEFAGEIVEVGDGVEGLAIADLVAVEPLLFCGECELCRAGDYNLCPKFGAIGVVGGGGAFAEFITVPVHLVHPLPEGVTTEQAAVAEPVCVGWHAVGRSGLRDGGSALVIGAGPIGLATLIALKARGAGFVAVADRSTGARRDAALALGADLFVDASSESIGDAIRAATGGLGPDVVFEVAGAQAAFDDAVDAVRPKGRIVSLAVWEKDVRIDLNRLLLKEVEIVLSLAYANEYRVVLDAIADGRISNLDAMVTGRIPLGEVVEGGFETLIEHRDDHVKILVHP